MGKIGVLIGEIKLEEADKREEKYHFGKGGGGYNFLGKCIPLYLKLIGGDYIYYLPWRLFN